MISILVAVVAVSVTLGGLILTGNCGLRQDVAQVEARLSEDVKQSESRLREDMGHLSLLQNSQWGMTFCWLT